MINGSGMAVRTVGKTKKRVMEGGKKTKMTTKWNLINLDLVPSLDKFSGEEEEGKGNCFFFLEMCSPSPCPFPTIPLPSQVEKATGCMGSDNAAAPVE